MAEPRLRGIAKVLRARSEAKSRFHTERDELMPLRAFVEIPQLVWLRARKVEPETPWIASPAVEELDRRLRRDWAVLELGSGRSTAWYAKRVASVLSVEHDAAWHRQVAASLSDQGVTNVDLQLRDASTFLEAVEALPDERFDMIVVDSGDEAASGDRVELVLAARAKLQEHGLLVLDNSDRRRYRRIDREMEGWRVRRFVSLQVSPLTASETSIYTRH